MVTLITYGHSQWFWISLFKSIKALVVFISSWQFPVNITVSSLNSILNNTQYNIKQYAGLLLCLEWLGSGIPMMRQYLFWLLTYRASCIRVSEKRIWLTVCAIDFHWALILSNTVITALMQYSVSHFHTTCWDLV